jgi:hypothetical protein
MHDAELERIIAGLVARKHADGATDAERAMLNRVLNGLRYKYEEAGGIWEYLDPYGFHATPP